MNRIILHNALSLSIAILISLSEDVIRKAKALNSQGDNFHSSRPISPEPHPYTVEPGRIDLELHPLFYSYNRHHPGGEDLRTSHFTSSVLAKFGLFHHLDFQIGFDLFVWEEVKKVETGIHERDQGFGDMIMAAKWNLWGNNHDGGSAFGVMPFVHIPTARHTMGSRAVQGGVAFPFAFVPADGWEIEWTPHFAAIHNCMDIRYEMEVGNLLTFNRSLFMDEFEFFLEFEAIVDSERHSPWHGSLSPGICLQVTPEIVLECGVIFGLTRAADDVAGFLTMVVRF